MRNHCSKNEARVIAAIIGLTTLGALLYRGCALRADENGDWWLESPDGNPLVDEFTESGLVDLQEAAAHFAIELSAGEAMDAGQIK